MTPLFLFGTLRDAGLLHAVAGEHPVARPAALADHETRAVRDQDFPILVAASGKAAQGLLLESLSDEARARIDFYETLFGYTRRPVTVETVHGPVSAEVYAPPEGRWEPLGTWSLDAWSGQHAVLACAAAEEVFARRGAASPDELARLYPFFKARRWSRLLAERHDTPTTLRHSAEPGDVVIARDETPFNGFFRVKSFDIAARQFDGKMGPVLSRECFVAFDAALVLPYDPVSDRVLMVEQLRFAPLWRGDPQPWALEPIAGLVDAGESPETAARREAQEEAGLTLTDLRPITGGYAAPGYVTEYYHCFLGVTALDPARAGIGGLVSESENIRSHIVSFDHALALIDTGEITTVPLTMMLLWLHRHRPALRSAAGAEASTLPPGA